MISAAGIDSRLGGADQIGPGTFVAVVGPSGAGKDTLIGSVRAKLGSDPRFHFVRRLVTRKASPADEDHDTIDDATFERMLGERQCALAWRAHGHGYALPLSLDAEVKAGRTTIANLSRAVLDEACLRYRSCIIVEVTAPPDILRQRLGGRGRETAEEIERRIGRAAASPIDGVAVITIDNSGVLVAAHTRFLEVLLQTTAQKTS